MNIKIPWIWLTVSLFVALELALLWVYSQQDERHRAVILFGATIVAGAFALYSYLHRIQEHRFTEAGKMMQRWNAPDRIAVRTVVAKITEGNTDLSLIQRKNGVLLDKDAHEMRMHVLTALNFYEELAIGIFEKSIDNDRSIRFFHSMANQLYERLETWIKNERNIDHTQTYYIEFERLIWKWRKQRG